MPNGFPNFRQIPSNYEVVMANRRAAALQAKAEATKDSSKYDSQSITSNETFLSNTETLSGVPQKKSTWRSIIDGKSVYFPLARNLSNCAIAMNHIRPKEQHTGNE